MRDKVVCPCCGTQVDPDTLPDRNEVKEIMDALDLSISQAAMFYKLWANKGRTVEYSSIQDYVDLHANKSCTFYGLKSTKYDMIKRLKKIKDIPPIKIFTSYSMGWRLVSDSKRFW